MLMILDQLRETTDPEDGIVQILNREGGHAGMAVFVGPRHVLTAAHVINGARGKDTFEVESPSRSEVIHLRFRFPYPTQDSKASVVKWGLTEDSTSSVDLAVLELKTRKPSNVRSARFTQDSVSGRPWKVYGQHRGENEPSWTSEGKVSEMTIRNMIQLDGVGVAGRWVDNGDSGAAVWCPQLRAVIGIVATRHRNSAENRISAMVPVKTLLDFCSVKIARKPWPIDRNLHWIERGSGTAAALAFLLALSGARSVMYLFAFLLAVSAGYLFWLRRRQTETNGRCELREPISEKAVLRDLLPFEDGDQLIGRSTEVQGVMTIIRSSGFRFGVVWGPSGCGKTSLFRAGLLSALRDSDIIPEYFPRPPKEGSVDEIADRLLNHLPNGNSTNPATTADKWTQVSERLKSRTNSPRGIVVLIDQFEEFFLRQRSRALHDPFRRWLGQCVADQSLPISFVVGIREDYFAKLQQLAPDIPDPTSTHSSYEIEELTAENARQVLEASLISDNTGFETKLIDQLVLDLKLEGRVRPSELQLVATNLKRKGITRLGGYEAVGSSNGILRTLIEKEISLCPSKDIARVVLRKLCAPDSPAKSPIDFPKDVLANEVLSAGLGKGDFRRQLDYTLQRLVSARIVLQLDDGKYNLVHDYFAPLVTSATEGLETQFEKANRLVRRYLAEFRSDSKTRIPLRHWLLIRKNSDLLILQDNQTVQSLMRKSFMSAMPTTSVLSILAIFAAPFAFVSTSFYISTEPPEFKGGNPQIVVRSGHPSLKVLPGFDRIVVDSGYTMANIPEEDPESRDAFPHETITGYTFGREHGHSSWASELASRAAPATQIQMRRLLGTPLVARKAAIGLLEASQYPEPAWSLGLVAIQTPSAINAEFIAPINDILKNENSASTRRYAAAARTMSHLLLDSQDKLQFPDDLFDQIIGDFIDTAIAPWRPVFRDMGSNTWELVRALRSLQWCVVATPDVVNQDQVDQLIAILRNGDADPWVKCYTLPECLGTVAAMRPDLSERIVHEVCAIVAEDYRASPFGGGWHTVNTQNVLFSIFGNVPDAVTPSSVKPLVELIVSPPMKLSIGNVAYVLAAGAASNPNIIDESIFKVIETSLAKQWSREDLAYDFDPEHFPGSLFEGRLAPRAQHVRRMSGIALLTLGNIRSELQSKVAVQVALEYVNTEDLEAFQKEDFRDAFVHYRGAKELLAIKYTDRDSLTDLSEDLLADVVLSSLHQTMPIQGTLPSGARGRKAIAIAELGSLYRDLFRSQDVDTLIDFMLSARTSSEEVRAAQSLISFSKLFPEHIAGLKSKLLHDAQLRVSSRRQIHDMLMGALARANFEIESKNAPDKIVESMLALLGRRDNSDDRLFGAYGLFLQSLEHPDQIGEIRQQLDIRSAQSHASIRMAANSALEMIWISQLVTDTVDTKAISRAGAIIDLLGQHSEKHIKFATQIAEEYQAVQRLEHQTLQRN